MHKIINKPWGYEKIIVNDKERDYCGKLIVCGDQIWSSNGKFHHHKIKDETFFVISGVLELHILDKQYSLIEHTLTCGEKKRIKPLIWHRFRSITPMCEFVEFSTFDSPDDSYRASLEEINMTTIICDIDGTLCRHNDNQFQSMQLLPGTREKLIEWQKKGYNLILITGKRESTRLVTEEQLERAGIAYDKLIMGVGPGKRYLINDMKPLAVYKTAIAINLKRDEGISKVEIDTSNIKPIYPNTW